MNGNRNFYNVKLGNNEALNNSRIAKMILVIFW